MTKASWPDVSMKFLDMYKKRPKLTAMLIILLLIAVGVGGAVYLRFKNISQLSAPIILNSTGSNNQNAGSNNGTMNQTNK